MPSRMAPPARQRPGAFRAWRLCAEAGHQDHRPVARVGSALAREADGLCREAQHPVDMKHKQGGSPYSMDANLLHISYEGRHLEDPAAEPKSRWALDRFAGEAPDAAEYLDLEFEAGRSGFDQRQAHGRTRTAGDAEPVGRQARHRPSRPGREPLRRHEVARLL